MPQLRPDEVSAKIAIEWLNNAKRFCKGTDDQVIINELIKMAETKLPKTIVVVDNVPSKCPICGEYIDDIAMFLDKFYCNFCSQHVHLEGEPETL